MRGAQAKKPNTRVQGQDKFFYGGPPALQARKTRGFFCCLMDSHCLDALGQVRLNDKPSRGEGEREARTDAVGLQRFPMHNPETKQICWTKKEMVKAWRVVASEIWPWLSVG